MNSFHYFIFAFYSKKSIKFIQLPRLQTNTF
jgi:hypothetical protein